MKKDYQKPFIEVMEIITDVITASGLKDPNVPDDGWG